MTSGRGGSDDWAAHTLRAKEQCATKAGDVNALKDWLSHNRGAIALIGAGVAGGWATIYYKDSPFLGARSFEDWMGEASFGFLFQFFVLIVLGGGLRVVHQRSVDARERQERDKTQKQEQDAEEKSLLLSTYGELVSAYNKTKRVRRLLRARVHRAQDLRASAGAEVILTSEYDRQMETLIDAQLEFESLERRVEGNTSLFDTTDLSDALNSIREYLRDTLDEYEDRRSEFEGVPPAHKLDELPKLKNFLGTYRADADHSSEFKKPFRAALRSLRLEIQARSALKTVEKEQRPVPPPTKAAAHVLGLADRAVKLVPYQPAWQELFETENKRLTEAVGERIAVIEHVGSTAIPGLPARPILDLLAGVPSLAEASELVQELARVDYEYRPDDKRSDLYLFERRQDDLCSHQLALVQVDSDYFRDQLRFREYLREDSNVRTEFADNKRHLVKMHREDSKAYIAGNSEFAQAILARIASKETGADTA